MLHHIQGRCGIREIRMVIESPADKSLLLQFSAGMRLDQKTA